MAADEERPSAVAPTEPPEPSPQPRTIDIPRDAGPLDSIGQRNELLRVRFSQLAHRLDDLKSLNDDFALLAEPLESIFTELPQAKSRILETEALLARELENGQNVRREVDMLSSRLSAVTGELRNEKARAQKVDAEIAELTAAFEETRLTLREKSGLLENAERQLNLEIEKQQSLAGDLAVQRAENQTIEKALTKAEASLQRESEQRSMFEKESRRLQQVVEDQLDRVATLQTQATDLTQQRERHVAEISALDAKLLDEQAHHQKIALDHETTISQLTAERSTMTLRLDALLARLGTTEQILGNVRQQFREKDEALRGAERHLKESAAERVTLDRRIEGTRGELTHYIAQLEESQRLQQELNDRCDMLNKALAAKDAALENALNKSASLADRIDDLTKRYENDRLGQEAVNRRLIEELENEKAERTLAQGALEIARENRVSLQRQNESLKRAVRSGQAHPDDQPQGGSRQGEDPYGAEFQCQLSCRQEERLIKATDTARRSQRRLRRNVDNGGYTVEPWENDMEKAVETTTSRSWMLRGSSEAARLDHSSPDKLVTLGPAPFALDGAEEETASPARRDWSAALDLIQEATEAIRLSEERVEELERQAEEQETRTRAEFAALRDQLQLAQREIENAYARATTAERQAQEANEWLARLNSAITHGFGRSPTIKNSRS